MVWNGDTVHGSVDLGHRVQCGVWGMVLNRARGWDGIRIVLSSILTLCTP